MNVTLLTKQEHFADMEHFAALAALTCHANTEKEFIPAEVLRRIIKAGHDSILEHINLTYSIKGISRALLQELSRHRHISLSVESTRHTLKKYIASNFTEYFMNEYAPDVLPEFWPTNLILTSNIRELRHILDLRTAPQALKEFRDFARELFNVVPDKFKYLLQDCVHQEAGE